MGDPINNFFLDDPQKLDNPFVDLAWLREHRPVHRHEPIGQWFVFSDGSSERERDGRDDFMGVMAAAARNREIREEEIVGSVMLLLIAGHLPVHNLIGNVVWLLLEHPAQHERVREDGSLFDERDRRVAAIRAPWRGRSHGSRSRTSPSATRSISAGEIVQLSIAAANRDPSHFPDPDTFDAARNPHGVLSFGHGPHGCLGARLAKEQATIALEVLFRRLGTDFHLDPAREVRWYRNAGNRGPEALPVSFASG